MLQRHGNKLKGDVDSCRFETRTCHDPEEWKHGRCFSCPEVPDGGCPEIADAFFENKAPAPGGMYFFNTLNVSEPGLFCGEHFWIF